MTPAPLTPSDCDLRDFAFMPLDVLRLRDSDLAAVTSGDEFRCAVLLWCASWHQVPAASLPDDDAVLSQLAGFGRVVKEWQKVRAGALSGWVKCSDGRLYHPVVAEKALDAAREKTLHAHKRLCDRLRKAGMNKDSVPSFHAWISSGKMMDSHWLETIDSAGIPTERLHNSAGIPTERPPDSTGIPAENALKGQGQGQGQGEREEPASAVAQPPPTSTSAGRVCARLRQAGIASVNPSNPRLIALLAAGMGEDELADIADEPSAKGKGFNWVLATAEGRRRDASNITALPPRIAQSDVSRAKIFQGVI